MPNNLAEWQEQRDGVDIVDDHTEQWRDPGEKVAETLRTHREAVSAKAQEVLKEKNLPGFGESKIWANPNLQDRQPENPDHPEVNIVSWNVQRGFKVDQQVKQIQSMDADIVCLQEVDVECERTGNKNIALEIAAGAGFKYCLFTTQVVKVGGGLKKGKLELNGGGVHGVAILSKYPIKGAKAIRLCEDKLPTFFEKRLTNVGGRVAQKACIQIGNKGVSVYNTHLSTLNEGTVQRLMEWDQIADDAEKETRPTIICGDFNTLDHGVARLLMPKDPTREQKGWEQRDSDFWEETEFSDSPKRAALEEGITSPRKKRYTDPNITPTFKIPGVFKGKLDYILLEKGKVSQRGNRIIPTKASDHDISTVRARID